MRKIKIADIFLIFTLIGVFFCQDLAYGLRVPILRNIERMNQANSKAVEIEFQYIGDLNDEPLKKLIAEALTRYFHHFKETPVFTAVRPENQQVIVDRIIEQLVGSLKTRLGPAPSGENEQVIRQLIRQSVERNIPIEAMTTWAPKKHYITGEDNSVDINELVALERLYDIHKQVESIYPPGMHYTLYLEDFIGNLIEGYGDDVQKTMSRYMETMERLVKILGISDVLRIMRMTQLAQGNGTLAQWYREADEHYPKLLAYWIESEQKGIEGYQGYDSYKELTKLGWVGPVPQSIRDYYRNRISRLYPGITKEGIRNNILREFSAIIVLIQHKALRGTSEVPPLKFSFIQTPAGTERERMRGRIDIRPVSVDVTKYSMPPWTGQGYLSLKRGEIRPLMRSWTDRINPSNRMIKGSLILRRSGMSVKIRADFLFDEKVDYDELRLAYLPDRLLPASNSIRDNL